MSMDVGMQQIMHAFTGGRDGSEGPGAEVAGSLELHVGRLARVLERQAARDQAEAQACAPVDLGPLDFTVVSGQPKLKAARSTTADNMSPNEGFYWFVTRMSLAGLNAGDLVNLHRTPASGIAVNSTAVHLFTGPASVGAGLGVADWEPGALGMILRPDDTFFLVSGGTLAASEIILTGQAIQVAADYLARYLL